MSEFQEITLAVIGPSAVGKSTFVKGALDLKEIPRSRISSKRVSLESKVSLVRLLELDLENVEITTEQTVAWPEQVENQTVPHVDGALALYDVTDQSSIIAMSRLLCALSTGDVPAILVCTKCDNPDHAWEIDPDSVGRFFKIPNSLGTFQTSATAPDSHKRCISVILQKLPFGDHSQVLYKHTTESEPRRTASTPIKDSRPFSESGAEASPPLGGLTFRVLSQDLENHPFAQENTHRTPENQGPDPSNRDSGDCDDLIRSISQVTYDQSVHHSSNTLQRVTPSLVSTPSDAYLNMIGSADDAQNSHEKSVAESRPKELSPSYPAESDKIDGEYPGSSINELVNRLLAQPMSKSDSKFVIIFLCLYRKFAAPATLLKAIIQRFDEMDDDDVPHLTRAISQLRYLTILKDWIYGYPGDFSHPSTRRIMTGFVQSLLISQQYAVAGKEISPCLDVVSEDYDTGWAFSDSNQSIRSRANTIESFLTMSSIQSKASTVNADSSTFTADSSIEDIANHFNPEEETISQATKSSAILSSISKAIAPDSQRNVSLQTALTSFEDMQCGGKHPNLISRSLLAKAQWHQLMSIPEEHIASELTRIDWTMYSSIRPRDLVRHVSLTPEQKERCKTLEHVNRMIYQFNHVAFWVSNMILLRDKAKHRAKMLEKFMTIAWKLRYLNNYNSLGAVIAGINGAAVHRLAQTRDLIPLDSQKQFMRLEILMGTQKSHSAYRLAYANTATHRIPFLPLHRRDLLLAEQANPTYVRGEESGRINWKKFEIMGEVIIAIRKSQEIPYPEIIMNEEVQRLVLDGNFCKDDDVLYERSLQLEAPSVGENTRKRFNWFQK